MRDEDSRPTAWRAAGASFGWVQPFHFAKEVATELRPYLGAKVDAYLKAAAVLVWVQRDTATVPRATIGELRAHLDHAARGETPHPDAVCHIDAALLLTVHVQPEDATPDQVRAAALIALRDFPAPRRGRPRRPHIAGRDALEESLAVAFHEVTGQRASGADAAACAAIILRAAGIDDADPESRQRAARRRRSRA